MKKTLACIVVILFLLSGCKSAKKITSGDTKTVFSDKEITVGSEQTNAASKTNSNPNGFSFASEKTKYKKGDAGVKYDNFVNTDESIITTDTEAVNRAKRECTVKYDTVNVYFDAKENVWMVNFYTKNTLGGDQSVYINEKGKTLLIVYGE